MIESFQLVSGITTPVLKKLQNEIQIMSTTHEHQV